MFHDQIDSRTVGIDDYLCEYTSLRCSVDDENLSGLDGDFEVVEKVMVGQSYYDSNSPLGTAKEVKGAFSTDSLMSLSNDIVYTIDEEPSKMSRGTLNGDHCKSLTQQGVNAPGIEKLYTRLQTFEADRESLRQVIVAMRTDQAQLVSLKEIVQHLSTETVTIKGVNPVSKMPFLKGFSVGMVFK